MVWRSTARATASDWARRSTASFRSVSLARAMGIKTVMITGDNPLTAAAIAREAGVDDFLAEATPKDKMDLIRREQGDGKLVAMTGDGTNDAPALAQADVGVAMNTGTQAAKEAGNMVDLDSNPTKLIEVVAIGKLAAATGDTASKYVARRETPLYIPENCTQCMECISVCPDTALPNCSQDLSTVLGTAIARYVSDPAERRKMLAKLPEIEKLTRQRMLAEIKTGTPLPEDPSRSH